METVLTFLNALWATWLVMGPYLLIGLLIAGILHTWLDKELLMHFLGKNGILQTVRAVLLGVPLPVCSCGVIPISATLRQKGAGPGATAGFMLTTPQTGVDSFYATWGILGAPVAIFRIVAATISGIVAGFTAQWVARKTMVRTELFEEPASCCSDNCSDESPQAEKPSAVQRLKQAAVFSLLTLPRDVLGPVAIGVLIAAVAQVWLPANAWGALDTPLWVDYFFVLAMSLPVYVCSTGAIPIAWALAVAGMSPGAVLIFLVGGPATNAGTFTMLAKTIGIRATLAALGILTFLLVLLGVTIDLLGINLLSAVSTDAHDHVEMTSTWMVFCSVLALGVFAFSYMTLAFRKRRAKKAPSCCGQKTEPESCCGD